MLGQVLGAMAFKVDDVVLIDTRAVTGHCRTPAYLRGKRGVIVEVLGRFRNPERLAYHKPGLPTEVLYKVRFAQSHVWDGYVGSARDSLEVDVYEHWLQSGGTP
jgi:nitrile hydratase subunit beta